MKFPKKKIKNIDSFYQEYIKVLNQTLKQVDIKKLKLISNLIEKKILEGKTIFVCGNGGSAAIANHFVCDYRNNCNVAIIREEGSNSDREMGAAFIYSGFNVYDVNTYDINIH